jgi:ribosome-binding protein aMBF1 (putative translation factor)
MSGEAGGKLENKEGTIFGTITVKCIICGDPIEMGIKKAMAELDICEKCRKSRKKAKRGRGR